MTTFEEYLQGRGRSPHTIKSYLGGVGEFTSFLGAREPTLDLLETWVDGLNHGRLTPQSTAQKIVAVRRWLAYSARHGSDPAQKMLTVLSAGYQVGRAVKQRDRKIVSPVTTDEFDEAMGRADAITSAIMLLLWWTGARMSEVVGDFRVGIPALTVADGESLVGDGHVQTFGKGGKRRVLVMPTAGRKELRPWVEGRAAVVGAGLAATVPLFPVGARGVSRLLKRCMNSLHPHRFRHAYRARLRQAHVSEEVVRTLMGHGPADVTEGYGRLGVEEMLQAVEVLSS